MAAREGGQQLNGVDIHGFTSEFDLSAVLAESHGPLLNSHEMCAVLMNAHLFARSPAPSVGADEPLLITAAPEGHEWDGADIHGFTSEFALSAAPAEAHGGLLNSHELCAILMNAHLFVRSPAPSIGADEPELYLITSDEYEQIEASLPAYA